MHPANLSDETLKQACDIRRTRRGGPGGQHRNKVETAIVATHLASGISGEGNEQRSQHANLKSALARLRINLAVGIRNEIDFAAFQPSPLWRGRVKQAKIAVNPDHRDFPMLACEALDVLAAAEDNLPAAADKLSISTSQLVKFFKLNSVLWSHVQRTRQQKSLPRLK